MPQKKTCQYIISVCDAAHADELLDCRVHLNEYYSPGPKTSSTVNNLAANPRLPQNVTICPSGVPLDLGWICDVVTEPWKLASPLRQVEDELSVDFCLLGASEHERPDKSSQPSERPRLVCLGKNLSKLVEVIVGGVLQEVQIGVHLIPWIVLEWRARHQPSAATRCYLHRTLAGCAQEDLKIYHMQCSCPTSDPERRSHSSIPFHTCLSPPLYLDILVQLRDSQTELIVYIITS